jgi:hypothetical protein
MIADFGASKQLSEATSSSANSTADGVGMIEYMEPQRFKHLNYKKTSKSDIYGLGVLLWEISSGRPPFLGFSRLILCTHIYYNNLREKPIEGTPLKYQQIYQKCWDGNPDLRPDIKEVYDVLINLKDDESPDPSSVSSQSQPDPQSSVDKYFDSKQSKLAIPVSFNISTETIGKVKNLLIIGYAGSGKSALSNVLCDTSDFEESEYSSRNTKNIQKKDFKWNETTYRVIDFEITSIDRKILYEEATLLMSEGISRVLFVIDRRFTEKEIEAFDLFERTIFDSGIVDYTTIVRTKFCNFKNKYKCKEDINQMCEESKTIAKMVKACSVIHVDNPPTNIIVNDGDDQERRNHNEKIRENSRKILLSHLGSVCHEKYYERDNVHTCMFLLYLSLFI